MKTYIIILDGAADKPNQELNNKTPLEYANTPGLSYLVQNGSMSAINIIGNGFVPESDSGTLALLSYDPLEAYPGRGALEGIGVGCVPAGFSAVAFRINFASIDTETGEFRSRIAKGLSSEQLRILTEYIEKNVDLTKYNTMFRLVTFEHHRGVLCLYSKDVKLSGNVSNTDPDFVKKGVWRERSEVTCNRPLSCVPLDDSVEAELTAEIINDFSHQVNCILSKHSVNKERESNGIPSANYFVIRDGGECVANLPQFRDKFGCSLHIYGQLPAEKAIAMLIGESFDYSNPLDDDLNENMLLSMCDTVLKSEEDVVYFHIKGPDEFGHENMPVEKMKSIEKIDKYFIQPLIKELGENDIVVVTCDHATPCGAGKHTADAVPLLISGKSIQHDETTKFDEKNADAGRLNIYKAIDVLPYVLGELRSNEI